MFSPPRTTASGFSWSLRAVTDVVPNHVPNQVGQSDATVSEGRTFLPQILPVMPAASGNDTFKGTFASADRFTMAAPVSKTTVNPFTFDIKPGTAFPTLLQHVARPL